MNRLSLLLGLLLMTGCAGPHPGPPPPAPASAGLDPHYEQAYAALRVHPAVQAFAAEHLAPSEPMAIEVSSELVQIDYAALSPDVRRPEDLSSTSPSRLTGGASASDEALPLLSMRQQRPLILFFSRLDDGRLAAELYPNPYRRQTYETVRAGTPGLALLVVFDGGAVAEVYTGPIEPE